jgi:hypothetical protein
MSRNGAGPIVSAHVFTFRSPRDAARSLARDRSRLAQAPGLRFARLVFAGARRREAMAPGLIDPRRQLAMCVWEEEAALDRFRERSPIGRAWRAQTDQHCEVRMAPFRTHGTYQGLEPLAGLRGQADHAGPTAMLTFANIPVRGLVYFYRGIHRSTEPLLASDGLIAAVAGPERLGRGGMTFTIWDSLPDALGFSYRREPHREIVRSVREHERLIDSMFIRARPYAIEGDWFPSSRFARRFEDLARSMPSAPAPGPPAATPPGPAFHSPTA